MKPRSALIIILATAGLLGFGLLGVVVVGRVFQAVHKQISSEQARLQFVASWTPPMRFTARAIFPEGFGAYRIATLDEIAGLKEPTSGVVWERALYRQADKPAVEVYAAKTNELEAEALVQRLRDAFAARSQPGSALQSSVQMQGRLRQSRSNPDETEEVWSLHGWLFVFRSVGDVEPNFIRAYLAAIRGREEH